MAVSTKTTLRLIAKSSPQPYGPLALAYYLQSVAHSTVQIEFVHSLTDGVNIELDNDGTSIGGAEKIMLRLADTYAASTSICGNSQNSSVQVNALLLMIPPPPPTFEKAQEFLNHLEQRMTLRTFMVGHDLSLADWAIWGAIKGNPIASAQVKSYSHVSRWYTFIGLQDAAVRAVQEIVAQAKVKAPKVNAAGVGGASKAGEPKSNATFDLGLPNAIKGQVVTRLPPEPSGYLHIGHAKAAILNQFFAKMYDGKFLIRFDDTNPSKENAEFEQSIIEDLALLGVKGDSTSYTSDYFDQLHIYCVEMIKSGHAYADDTEQEKMRDERMNGVPSSRRDSTAEESLARFADMATGSTEGKRWCIRAKISYEDPNKAMRDPVIYRGNDLPHHRSGTKYKIYPTYDFACPIVDSLEGVTHALRTNEYRDRNPQYMWMLKALNLRRVDIWDYGRMSFVYTLLSKRKLKWFVEEGHVAGWDDPRFPTVRGIRRRGMTVEAITQYMLQQGPSQAYTILEWDTIWNLNKKVIDPVAPRHVAIEKKDIVKVNLRGDGAVSKPEIRKMPKHKKNPEVGTKQTTFSYTIYIEQKDAKSFAQNEEITLMDWGNAFVRKIGESSSGIVDSLELDLNLGGDFKKTEKKVTWLAAEPSQALTSVSLLDYDYLITKKKLEDDDDVKDFLTPTTEFRAEAVADANVKECKKGDIIQFERKGYYIIDEPYTDDIQSIKAILIPDGKASSIALKHVVTDTIPNAGGKAMAQKAVVGGTEKPVAIIPEPAPSVAVETVLLSNVKNGFEIPVKTKMFRVAPIYGNLGVEAPARTKMFDVKPVHQV